MKILMWEEVKVTGIIFLSGLVFLLSCLHLTFLSVLTNLALWVSLSTLATKIYVHLMGFMKKPCRDILASLDTAVFLIDKETMDSLVKTTSEKIIFFLGNLRSLLLVHNFEHSAKFSLLLYCLTYLGKIIWRKLYIIKIVFRTAHKHNDIVDPHLDSHLHLAEV